MVAFSYMVLLVLDTSDRSRVRVVLSRDMTVLGEQAWERGRDTSVRLLRAVDHVLRRARVGLSEVDRIAVYRGPGSFMVLRSGVVVATLLAWSCHTELVGFQASVDLTSILAEACKRDATAVIAPDYGSSWAVGKSS